MLRGRIHPPYLPVLLIAVFLFSCFFVRESEGINVLNQRVEVPKPDGSGVVFVQLRADPADPNIGSLTGFNITGLTFVDNLQRLRLWNSVAFDCSGTALSVNSFVPADGKLCFLSNVSSPSAAEFQNSFTFVALGSGSANSGTIMLINYNRQRCTGIPDLGGSGSFKLPPTPKAAITLSGLQIQFSVNVTYVRNQTTWFMDFFPFNNTAGSSDSPDGTGRTCSNHKASNYPSSFSDWWYSGVRATYTSAIHPSIQNALGSTVYPNWNTAGTVWTATALDCSTVNFQATIAVSSLIGNTVVDCHQAGNNAPAATTSGNQLYTGVLYVNALRPISSSSASAGYYMSTYPFPFSFSIQTTVTSISSTSSKWAFAVDVVNSQVLFNPPSPSYTLDLQTTISSPTLTSPNILSGGFSLLLYPLSALRQGLSRTPVLTRVSDNGNCNTGSTSPCKIQWRTVMPQLTLAQMNNSMSDFDTQYTGEYAYQWVTEVEGDKLSADIYIDVSAIGPYNNVSTLPINSSVSFYVDKSTTQDTSNAGISPAQYSSGERIWVRHSFLTDSADVKAFVFSLKSAWVCFSDVPGYTPTLAAGGTGCSQDIPGVMEEANGQRYLLYDSSSLSGGIPNTPATPGAQRKIWSWQLVPPTDSGWSGGSTVNNGFSINAQPLAVDSTIRTYYFHLISTVAQASLGRRSEGEYDYHHIIWSRSTNGTVSGNTVSAFTVKAAAKSSASSGRPLLGELWKNLKGFFK